MKRWLFLLFLLPDCAAPVQKENDYLTLPVYRNASDKPPYFDYLDANLIVDSMGNYYYYRCSRSRRVWDGEEINCPWFIDLHPAELIRLPEEGLLEFLQLNRSRMDTVVQGQKDMLAIALEKDSIQHPFYRKLKAFLREGDFRWGTRLLTQEETVVLRYKRNDLYYAPESIKWDSTKTQFITVDTSTLPLRR